MNPQVGPLLGIAPGSDPKTQEEIVSPHAKLLLAGFWFDFFVRSRAAVGTHLNPIQTELFGLVGLGRLERNGHRPRRQFDSLRPFGPTRGALFRPQPFGWWAWVDSNYRPRPYQGRALTT